MSNLETRVVYKGISVLADEMKQYIVAHTENNRYVGRLDILEKYKSAMEYLRK